MDKQITIGMLKAKIKNMDDDQPLAMVVGGREFPVHDAVFHSSAFLLFNYGTESTPAVSPLGEKAPILMNVLNEKLRLEFGGNMAKKIHTIKLCRELTGWGLMEAKLHVEALIDGRE